VSDPLPPHPPVIGISFDSVFVQHSNTSADGSFTAGGGRPRSQTEAQMERTASGKTNVIPYSQYRKSRLDSIRNDLGLQGESATRPYDTRGVSVWQFVMAMARACLLFAALNTDCRASHAWTLFALMWALGCAQHTTQYANRMKAQCALKVSGCLPFLSEMSVAASYTSVLALAFSHTAHVGVPGGQRDGVSGIGNGTNKSTAGGLGA
jgi:hypothetical protein